MAEELVKTSPNWTPRWGLTKEAAESLWERAATRILEAEDAGKMNMTVNEVWRELHRSHPSLYPKVMPDILDRGWASDEDWLAYLNLRRQEHLVRSYPTRLQILRYHSYLLSRAGSEVVRRLAEDPEAFTNRELIAVLRDSTAAISSLEKDIKRAAGEETNVPISLNIFSFVDKVPADRQHLIAAAIAQQQIRSHYDTKQIEAPKEEDVRRAAHS